MMMNILYMWQWACSLMCIIVCCEHQNCSRMFEINPREISQIINIWPDDVYFITDVNGP